MRNILYIFLGGGAGSVLRFLISGYTQKLWNVSSFPLGTFIVNITGCFAIGLFSAVFIKTDNPLKFLLITGLCGGYTTFSAFSAENFSLWQEGHYGTLTLYTFLSVAVGLLAVFAGFYLAKD